MRAHSHAAKVSSFDRSFLSRMAVMKALGGEGVVDPELPVTIELRGSEGKLYSEVEVKAGKAKVGAREKLMGKFTLRPLAVSSRYHVGGGVSSATGSQGPGAFATGTMKARGHLPFVLRIRAPGCKPFERAFEQVEVSGKVVTVLLELE